MRSLRSPSTPSNFSAIATSNEMLREQIDRAHADSGNSTIKAYYYAIPTQSLRNPGVPMTNDEFYARRNEFLIPGVVPKTLHEWLDWSSVNELRAEYPDLDIVDYAELQVGDEFLYRFPHAPRHMRRITPTPPSSANALNLETGGRHILCRWENHAVPVVRLKAGEPVDPALLVPRPPVSDEDKYDCSI